MDEGECSRREDRPSIITGRYVRAKLEGLSGYRRLLRYKLGPRTPLTKGEDVPLFLAMHEVESARGFMESRAEGAKKTTPSEWAVKNVKGCRIFTLRGWKLVHQEGY